MSVQGAAANISGFGFAYTSPSEGPRTLGTRWALPLTQSGAHEIYSRQPHRPTLARRPSTFDVDASLLDTNSGS
ncbi:hypothetical protein V8D89_003934 [Ganoderma adspersum]